MPTKQDQEKGPDQPGKGKPSKGPDSPIVVSDSSTVPLETDGEHAERVPAILFEMYFPVTLQGAHELSFINPGYETASCDHSGKHHGLNRRKWTIKIFSDVNGTVTLSATMTLNNIVDKSKVVFTMAPETEGVLIEPPTADGVTFKLPGRNFSKMLLDNGDPMPGDPEDCKLVQINFCRSGHCP